MILQRFLALAAVVSLAACGGGIPPLASTASQDAPASASRTTDGIIALTANGTMALPGNGTMALPGGGLLASVANGTMALPGSGLLASVANGTMALPGGGLLALPGNGTMALPGGGGVQSLLASLLNALPVCAVASLLVHTAQCNALLNTTIAVIPNANLPLVSVPGLHPTDIQSAYRIPSGGAGRTVAVIDAGDDPTAEADLAVYRKAFGLPACTTSNRCFRKVSQSGSTGTVPAVLTGWPQETGIDIEMISAVCASCNILLVEANSADVSDLAASVDTAVALGANAVSNSYYAPEYNGELTDETHFNHPGTAITVSSGDTGYGTTFPASSRYVTAVGGTTLVRGGARGWNESVWSATGSGCSTYVPKPSWQHDTGCTNRTVADVAVVGNPQTGVAVYNTSAAQSQQGWGVYGGTSVGAPIVAAMYAIAGSAPAGASLAYANTAAFFGVVTGNNGTCSPAYLCTAGIGYNGPGGVGTPDGVSGL
jgi:subtilase family serine protease